MYTENYETLLKDLNKWKYISWSWIRRLKIVNMSLQTNLQNKQNPYLNSKWHF